MTLRPDLWSTVKASMPHSGPALLLTGVLSAEPGWVEAVARVPAGHPLVEGGEAPSFLGLELGAQAAAALDALQRRPGVPEPARRPRRRKPRRSAWYSPRADAGGIGYLVRVRDASFLEASLPCDTELRVTARLEGAVPPLALFRIGVWRGEVELVRALLATHRGSG